jgi:hypothetical protein
MLLPNGEEEEIQETAAERVAEMLRAEPPEFWRDAVYVQGPDDSGWVSVLRLRGRGWVVSCMGRSDAQEHFLADSQSNDRTPIAVRKGGRTEDYPARLFVAEPEALDAVTSFIRDLERSAAGSWLSITEAMKA